MRFNRQIKEQVTKDLINGQKVVVIYGPRQVGKTTLANTILDELKYKSLRINAEQIKYQAVLSSRDASKLKSLIGDHQLLFIDEAQYIDKIGLNLKLIHDHLPGIKVLVTGSSSFDLASKISEPLTGRAWTYTLFPISYSELAKDQTEFALNDQLEERLVFGSYPEVVTTKGYQAKQRLLQQIVNSYLFKDIFTFASIRYHSTIKQLLKLIAFQIGNQVSIHELATQLGIGREIVNNYLNLLQKSFVIFRLPGFSRNLRNETTKMDKIFFYDLGVRNTMIDNYKLLDSRQDKGQLWENFLIGERMKRNSYAGHFCSSYFWRLHTGAELDYIEEYNDQLYGYEFKWQKKQMKAPPSWLEAYPKSDYQLISNQNYFEFVT